jgi:hypothetical protein
MFSIAYWAISINARINKIFSRTSLAALVVYRLGPECSKLSSQHLLYFEWTSRGGRRFFYPPMPEQHAYVFEVLIGHVAERRDSNAVFSNALRVLGRAECFEPNEQGPALRRTLTRRSLAPLRQDIRLVL